MDMTEYRARTDGDGRHIERQVVFCCKDMKQAWKRGEFAPGPETVMEVRGNSRVKAVACTFCGTDLSVVIGPDVKMLTDSEVASRRG